MEKKSRKSRKSRKKEKAKKKFSVLIENKSALQITRALLLGVGKIDTIVLPTKVATPITVLTIPRATSPPFSFERIIAGKAALYGVSGVGRGLFDALERHIFSVCADRTDI